MDNAINHTVKQAGNGAAGKERSVFWDNLKGILIFLVVFGHFIYSYANRLDESLAQDIYVFIYSFHMPAFIFCSGYFSKSPRSRSGESLLKLFLYYVIFDALMGVFAYFYLGTSVKFLTPYYSYWYLISLICWRFLIGGFGGLKALVPLSVVLSLAVGYWSGISNELSLRRTMAFFVFFAAGYTFDWERFKRRFTLRGAARVLAAALCAALACLFWMIIDRAGITDSMTLMSAYKNPQDVLLRMLLLAMAGAAIVMLLLLTPHRRIPLLSRIGKNSLLIYLGHRFLTILYYTDLFHYKTYSDVYLLYALAATVVTCAVLGGERINAWIAGGINRTAALMMDRENRMGRLLRTLILLLVVGVLLIKAAPGFMQDMAQIAEQYKGIAG